MRESVTFDSLAELRNTGIVGAADSDGPVVYINVCCGQQIHVLLQLLLLIRVYLLHLLYLSNL